VLESANGDERVCAVTWNEPDDSDLVHYDPVNDQLSTAPGAFGARPSGARAWSGGCWFSFQSDPGEVLHYDGSTVEPVDAPGTGEVISLDVDRDGNAWFAAVHTPGAYQALMAPPGGTATLVLDTEFEPVLQVEVQERCAASCAPGAARDLWIACGGSILRLDGDYRVMQVYELSIAPTITSLVVLP